MDFPKPGTLIPSTHKSLFNESLLFNRLTSFSTILTNFSTILIKALILIELLKIKIIRLEVHIELEIFVLPEVDILDNITSFFLKAFS